MNRKLRELLKGVEIRTFCVFSVALLFSIVPFLDTPQNIMEGMYKIIISRDILITDYFALAGYGAAFFNAGLMMLIAMGLIAVSELPYTGLTLASVFISAGFGLWGKNPVNMLPIVLGVWFYASIHKLKFTKYTYTSIFAGCLSPFVTEFAYILPFSQQVNIICALLLGVAMGFAIAPLATHTTSVHMGYSLFNVGFAGGTLGFIVYSLVKSMGMASETVFIWQEGIPPVLAIALFLYFVITFLFGFWLEEYKISGIFKIMRHPGRTVTDFVMLDGRGNTLMNMALMGIVCELFIICIGGDLSGPVLGCILTVFGFSAFGAHLKNYLPVLAGVVIATFFMMPEISQPAMQIAAMLVVGIAPIAGEFGAVAGILSGMVHVAVVSCTGAFYGGLNLYNNGFSAGWVAIFMVPILESFMERFKKKKV
uniref:DUF1576 domain-containing protein n=1 Tax=Agathobacter sp. TaxID=2021311 RepID=UPI004056DFC8